MCVCVCVCVCGVVCKAASTRLFQFLLGNPRCRSNMAACFRGGKVGGGGGQYQFEDLS